MKVGMSSRLWPRPGLVGRLCKTVGIFERVPKTTQCARVSSWAARRAGGAAQIAMTIEVLSSAARRQARTGKLLYEHQNIFKAASSSKAPDMKTPIQSRWPLAPSASSRKSPGNAAPRCLFPRGRGWLQSFGLRPGLGSSFRSKVKLRELWRWTACRTASPLY